MMDVLGISGSLRAASLNRKLLVLAGELAGHRAHVEVASLTQIPMYNPDLEMTGTPEVVTELKSRIERADGVLFACPVYYGSITGALKNAVDWICRTTEPSPGWSVLGSKPVAVLGGGGGGGSQAAQQQLYEILSIVGANLMQHPVLDYVGIVDRVDEDGFLNQPVDRERLSEFVTAFLDHIERSKSQ